MKKYLIFLVSFLFSNNLLFSLPFGNGNGSEQFPYQIFTKEHLKELSDSMYNDDRRDRDEWWHFDKHFELTQDIENASPLFGSLLGYFRCAKKEVIITDENRSFVGSIYGILSDLILDGCLNGSNVGVCYNTMFLNNIYGSHIIMQGFITNCISNITVTCFPCEYVGPFGDIFYYQVGGIAVTNNCIISHCINNGSVSGKDYVGGIATINLDDISNCINTGKVTSSDLADNSYYSGTGGIVARNQFRVSNCINLGDVEGINQISGITGTAFENGGYSAVIINSINAGYVKGKKYVGGILGIKYSSNVNISNCINIGVIEGEEDVGSIVGKE